MAEPVSRPQHEVLVSKDKLTSKGLYPSSQELYDLMHIVSCEHAVMRWQDHWSFCPVCLNPFDDKGYIMHKTRKELTV